MPGIFLGDASYVGGGIWKEDIMVADIEESEEDASEIHARRLNEKDVLTPMKGDKFKFPVADGTVKTLWRRSTSETIHLYQGSS